MTELTELFTTNDMIKLKQELARLVRFKKYKTLNTLFRRNPNITIFNTRELNEEILCDDRYFTKCKVEIKFETRAASNKIRKKKTIIFTKW